MGQYKYNQQNSRSYYFYPSHIHCKNEAFIGQVTHMQLDIQKK